MAGVYQSIALITTIGAQFIDNINNSMIKGDCASSANIKKDNLVPLSLQNLKKCLSYFTLIY